MTRYANRGGDSGIVAYQIEAGQIAVDFDDGWRYIYTNDSAGADDVAHMRTLARAGEGLNAFINCDVRDGYAQKVRWKRA
jgi:hypothetical protein